MKKRSIAFYIIFPIVFLLIGAILLFYLDLANGPFYLFIAEIVILVLFAISVLLFRGRRFFIRVIPWGLLIAANVAIVMLAHPTETKKSAAYYSKPVYTSSLTLANGDIKGVYNKDKDVEIYAGIPYAQAPVGELRWKEPKPIEGHWDGVLDCSYFAPKSMQPGSNAIVDTLVDMYASKGWHPNWKMTPLEPVSEDSLYLNIWRPASISEPLPILVFIHGGSLTTGSSSFENYNGEMMAKQNVIMITITYRLGVFGYFAHPDLKDESPNGTTGNYGLLDQIQALRWVNENASYFGGDKTKITIAGESAGSSSVSALCTSPLASGLFQRAIGESSSLVLPTPPHTFRTLEAAYEVGEKIMEEQKCNSVEELRKIPAKDLVKTKFSNSMMTIDGYALTKTPYESYAANEVNANVLLNGTNNKESDAFVVPTYLLSPTNKKNIGERLATTFGKEIGARIEALYREKIEEDAFAAFNEIITVYWFIYPHYVWSNIAESIGQTVYRYQFTKENGYYGTYHSGEMIYAYGNVSKSTHGFAYDESDLKLSKTMLGYWSNFVKTGDPNGEGLPTWNPYHQAEAKVQELGNNVAPMDDPYLGLYAILNDFFA